MDGKPTLYDSDCKALRGLSQVEAFAALLYLARAGEHLGEVRLTQRELADATGIGERWIQRRWSGVTGDGGPLELVRPGVYRANPDAWPELPDRGRFHRLRPRVVVDLLALGGRGRIGLPALRLALHLLGRLRAALYRGHRYIIAPDRGTARAIGSAPITVRRAFAELEAAGLVRTDLSRGPRRVLAFSRLAATPAKTRPSDPVTRPNDPALTIRSSPTGGGTQTQEAPGAPVARRLADLGFKGTAVAELGAYVADVDTLDAWIQSEAAALEQARNRCGMFLWLVRVRGSRPGRPSGVALDTHADGWRMLVPETPPPPPPDPLDRLARALAIAARAQIEADKEAAIIAQTRRELSEAVSRAQLAADRAWSEADPDDVARAVRDAADAAAEAADAAAVINRGALADCPRATTAATRAAAALERPEIQATLAARATVECEAQDEAKRRNAAAARAMFDRFRRSRRAQR